MVEQDFFVFNGVHRRTGQLWAPELAGTAVRTQRKVVPPWIDSNDLEQFGWGLVLCTADPDAAEIREALAPLIAKRREDTRGRLVVLECGPGCAGAPSAGATRISTTGSTLPGCPITCCWPATRAS